MKTAFYGILSIRRRQKKGKTEKKKCEKNQGGVGYPFLGGKPKEVGHADLMGKPRKGGNDQE